MPTKEILDKIKTSFSTIVDKLHASNTQLAKVVKDNSTVLKEESILAKKNKKAIEALEIFATQETPGLQDALTMVSSALNTIQSNREAMVEQLKFEFITPLEELINKWLAVQKAISDEAHAQSEESSAKKSLEKKQAMPSIKLKPGELEEAAQKVELAAQNGKLKQSKVIQLTGEYNEAKIKTLKETLTTLMERYNSFHNQAVNIMGDAIDSIEKIDINKEISSSVAPITSNSE